MKKKRLIIAAVVLWSILVLLCSGLLFHMISYDRVERIELKTYSHGDGYDYAELDQYDTWRFITHYNLSSHIYDISACEYGTTFWVTIWLDDGTAIQIAQYNGARMRISLSEGEMHWIDNLLLFHLIRNLIDEYGLVRGEPAPCGADG